MSHRTERLARQLVSFGPFAPEEVQNPVGSIQQMEPKVREIIESTIKGVPSWPGGGDPLEYTITYKGDMGVINLTNLGDPKPAEMGDDDEINEYDTWSEDIDEIIFYIIPDMLKEIGLQATTETIDGHVVYGLSKKFN